MTKSIASLLALAVTTSLALANGPNGPNGGEGEKKANPYQSGNVSWKPGSGITLADSDEFGLKLKNQLQVQWSFESNDNAPDVNSFDVRRARTALSGHVFNRDILFLLKVDGVDTGPNLKDGWAQWNFNKNDTGHLGLRMGQSKPMYGLEATGSSAGLFFVERSASTKAFSDVRSRGAWVHGSHMENKLRWNAGAQNGTVAADATGLTEIGEEATNPDNELTFVVNVSFDPLGDILGGKDGESYKQGDLSHEITELRGTVGAGLEVGNHRAGGNDVESTAINVNTAWFFGGGLSAQGEIYLRSDDPTVGGEEDTTGFYVAGHYALPKSADSDIQWGFGFRFDMIDLDDTVTFMTGTSLGTTPGDVTEISAVADAFYHGHSAKTQFEYTWQDLNPTGGGSSTNHILRVMFTLIF